jgi:hypothetical protein
MSSLIFASLTGCLGPAPERVAETAPPFIAAQPDPAAPLPPIVLQHEPAAQTGFDWNRIRNFAWYQADPGKATQLAVLYLREAVQRMTGRELTVVSTNDLSHGIVLTLFRAAPADIRNDRAVLAALRNTGADAYNANEAFFVRTETNRIVIVAHTEYGLSHGVVELLESVAYQTLGMGPNWVHVPDYRRRPLVFALRRSGRPGYYLRSLVATSGQSYGVGTLFQQALTPPDENVDASYARWLVGTRLAGQSMPHFPGHALQAYHRAVLAQMRERKTGEGFLVEHADVGTDSRRPPASAANAGHLWVNDDPAGSPAAGKVFLSDGARWEEQDPAQIGVNLDLSVPFVRAIVLEAFKRNSAAFFEKNPDEVFVFGTDTEDGGGDAVLAKTLRYPNWYPEYLARAGVAFGRPYALHRFKGLNQPRELWDPAAASDHLFGFNNWLLREYDRWIDSLPPAHRATATGKSKKEQVRCSFYSYNYHDVPPNFNLDPRIRVMIASYPKHRGWGQWKNFRSQVDLAQAFKVMLPREPSGDYWIISLAYYWDSTSSGIAGSESAGAVHRTLQDEYRAGIKALCCETDFNFGKSGLTYYLYSKMLWNPHLTAAELEALRERWLQRAFGSAWREMKAYYDFMTPANFTVNAPNYWAQAIRLIDAADRRLAGANEPDAQRRLDDLKQFWYFCGLSHFSLPSDLIPGGSVF